MPTNLEVAASKLLHPSNSEKFFPHDRDSIQTHYAPFPIVEFLHEELSPAYVLNKPSSYKAEYADDNLVNPLHSDIIDLINRDATYGFKYKGIVDAFHKHLITVDEFMYYGRVLSKAEAAKQVSKNPGTTGKPASKTGKLPSQNVNSATLSGSAESRTRGILSIGFIRTIASKFLANWGSKGKS